MNIIFDIDGCLLDWNSAFEEWMTKTKKLPPQGDVLTYDISSRWPDLTQKQQDDLIREFSEHASFARMAVYDGAITAVRELRRALPKAKLIALSACGAHPYTVLRRAGQLLQFRFNTLYVIDLHESKIKFFRRYAPALVIEDNVRNMLEAEAYGCRAVCVDRPYNQEWQGSRIHSWNDGVETIIEQANILWPTRKPRAKAA